MNPNRSCLRSFSFSLLILLISFSSKNALSDQLGNWCRNSTYNPEIDRGYVDKLNSVLSSLSSNASAGKLFSSHTETGVDGDFVYGHYLCRGDVNTADCKACVQTASKDILTVCPNDISVIIWYDDCLFCYSSELQGFPAVQLILLNPENSTDPERFDKFVRKMLNELATNLSSGENFAVLEGNFSATEKFFSLGQCTPIITNCGERFRIFSTWLNNYYYTGARLFDANAFLRYETFRFYNVVPPPAPPAPATLVQNNTNPQATATNLTLPPPPSNSQHREGKKHMSVQIKISISVLIVVAVIILVVAFVCLRKRTKTRNSTKDGEEILTVESLKYSLSQVQNATKNFSEDCKIGLGGFGPVYKGTLSNGEEVAVKRLSQSSVQGLEEFKNEIVLLARLQHRNLVRLLGFCFEHQEMILIYEFFCNKSLDNFPIDPEKRRVLDWTTRHMIIEGIARGLLYLHEDSRLRIIHRDLKASNVLLDDNMNPKIADFGTARLLQLDQSEENTKRIAGTYGYMAPEYAIYGHISVKSDVFSFGMLLLEIISGQKNNTFYQSNGVDLRSYAWKNFMNGIPLALLDPSVGELYSRNEVIHCIHVGLLCVQEDPQARPTMASVVIMLSSSSVTLPIPLQPAFFAATHAGTGNVMQPELPCSVSETDASFTELFPR